jgi:hypothetical protein
MMCCLQDILDNVENGFDFVSTRFISAMSRRTARIERD